MKKGKSQIPQKQAAISFLQLASSGKVQEAYRTYVGEAFRHHNPFFQGHAKALMTAMGENAAQHPDMVFDVLRVLEDGDLVAVHSHVMLKPGDRGIATVHIFRFEGDRIVELWDVGQPVPDETPNRYGMF